MRSSAVSSSFKNPKKGAFSKKPKRSKFFKRKPLVALVPKSSRPKTPLFRETIDYKNVVLLRKCITAQGKILPRRISGLTAKQQRSVAKAIKNGRMVGLLPFINKSK
jgi:small subunit ribosomal protein S18